MGNIAYDMQGVDISPNINFMKTYYAYRCPRFVGIGVTDRDFLMTQKTWWDFSEPGLYTSYMNSIEDLKFPLIQTEYEHYSHNGLICQHDKNA